MPVSSTSSISVGSIRRLSRRNKQHRRLRLIDDDDDDDDNNEEEEEEEDVNDDDNNIDDGDDGEGGPVVGDTGDVDDNGDDVDDEEDENEDGEEQEEDEEVDVDDNGDDNEDDDDDDDDDVQDRSMEEYVSLRKMDVTTDRSNLMHPGNVYHRKLIEENYVEYSKVPLRMKNAITKKILVRVRKRAGRFVRPANVTDDKGQMLYIKLSHRESSVKTTLALRTRIKLEKKMKKETTKKMKLTKKMKPTKKSAGGKTSGAVAGRKDDVDDEGDDINGGQDESSVERVNIKTTTKTKKRTKNSTTTTADDDDDHHTGESSSREYTRPPRAVVAATTTGGVLGSNEQQLGSGVSGGDGSIGETADEDDVGGRVQWVSYAEKRSYDRVDGDFTWNDNFRQLQLFHKAYGHSAVPVTYQQTPTGDRRFADWVSRQRQLFREIHSGYRIATPREERRWERLRTLEFPLDYEGWHWRRKFNELREVLGGHKYDEDTYKGQLSPQLQLWLNQQQQLMSQDLQQEQLYGLSSRMDKERKGKLGQLGVVPAAAPAPVVNHISPTTNG